MKNLLVIMMGKLIQNPDGTHTFKGGFSTRNKEDMERLRTLVFKPISSVVEEPEGEPKIIEEPVETLVEEVPEVKTLVPIEEPKEESKSLVEEVKDVVKKAIKSKPKTRRAKKKKEDTSK